MNTPPTTTLIPAQTIRSMQEAYDGACRRVVEANKALDEMGMLMKAAFGGGSASYAVYRYPRCPKDKQLNKLKEVAWKYVIQQTGIDQVMTTDRRNEFETQLESRTTTVPDFTVDNVLAFLEQMRGDLPAYVEESIGKLYNLLRPTTTSYKTNNRWQLGEKVILECILYPQNRYCSLGLDWRREGDVHLLDIIFHLLDGQGVPQFHETLVSGIREGIRKDERSCDTRYFHCKWFKKGTLHIKFKRLDLVTEINRIAGGGQLKPEGAYG